MIAVMVMGVALIAMLCVLAYTLAVYALPFMFGLTVAQFAYKTGSSFIGAGLVGLAQPVRPSASWRCCSTRCAHLYCA